jgi:hypothetical protein
MQEGDFGSTVRVAIATPKAGKYPPRIVCFISFGANQMEA